MLETFDNVPAQKRSGSSKQSIGDILVAKGIVSREKIEEAVAEQISHAEKRGQFEFSGFVLKQGLIKESDLAKINKKYRRNEKFGESLVKDKIISEEELTKILKEKAPHEFLGETILAKGILDKQELYERLANRLNVPHLPSLLVQEGLIEHQQLQRAIHASRDNETIGQILVNKRYISVIQLYSVLKEGNKRRSLGEMLLEAGLVSNEQLELALEKQKFTKTTLGETLINDNTIEEDDLFHILASQYGMKYFSGAKLDGFSVEQGKLTKIISQIDALKYRIIPLSFENRHLKVAIFDPHTLAGVGGFDAIMNFNIDIALIREGDFYRLFEQLYGAKPLFETPMEEIGAIEELGFKEIGDESEQSYSKYVGGEKDNEAKKLLNIIISYSVKIGASDIHLESDVNGFTVRLRVDGMLRPLTDRTLSPRINAKASAIINRIKVLSKLDIAERRIPQDGAFRLSYFDKNLDQNISIDFRVATCATGFGEGATIRVIDPTKASVRLDQLGHSSTMLRELTEYLKSLSGMFLVTGPTGSGKTSTIYAMLNYLSGPEVKVVTAEDPVEYKIPGAFQSQVNRKIGLTFARLLKSFLRMDPDVILLGEIRDKETSEIALDAAMTGHMLISSLHTGDAIGAISRLRDLGISNLVIANALKGVISQRLVRTLCVHCKRPYMPDKKEWESIFPEEPVHLSFYKADGCARCQYTGFRGRSVVSEALLLNDEIARSILKNEEESKLYTTAKRANVRFMIDDALAKLDQTTLSEIIRVLPHDSISRYKKDQATINSVFPPFKKQEGSSLEFQTVLIRSPRGLPKGRTRELFDRFKKLRHHLFEPNIDINPDNFHLRLTKYLTEESKAVYNQSGDEGHSYHRISLLSRNGRSVMMVETLCPPDESK